MLHKDPGRERHATYTPKVCPLANPLPCLSTCQQYCSRSGEIHVMALPSSLSRAMGEADANAARQARSVAAGRVCKNMVTDSAAR